MKYLFCVPTLSGGGMERFTVELSSYFSKFTDAEVYILLYGRPVEKHYQPDKNVKIVENKNTYKNTPKFIEAGYRMFWLRRQIKRISPDIVMSVGTFWNKFVLLSLLGLKVPVVISDRGNPFRKHPKWKTLLGKWLYPMAAGIVAQTNEAKTVYKKKNLNNNIVVIPNPIRKIERRNESREKIIISIGRLIRSKNFDRLISNYATLNNKEWKLMIVGGSPRNNDVGTELENQIKSMGLEKNVILTGNVKNVDPYLLKSSIFAFTSSSEGFPNAIGEAMSAGLPVIAYDCPTGPSDLIENGQNGFLIPLYDDELFVEKMKFLLYNEPIRKQMGEKSKIMIEEFLPEKIGISFARLFDDIINKHTQ